MGSTGTNINTGLTSTTGWDYREYKQSVDNIEKEFNKLQNNINKYTISGIQRQVNNIVKSLDNQDTNITKELELNKTGTGDSGDERVLMTQRRRVRQLKKQVLDFGKNNL